MTTRPPDDSLPSSNARGRQITIMTHLLKAVTTMYSIDELFQWLSYAFVQYFDLEASQFWTPIINENGILTSHLRMMMTRDPSLPRQLVYNNQIAAIARQITFEQNSTLSQAVDSLLPAHQASVLKRYNLNYCIGGFISNNALLPLPNAQNQPSGHRPVPFSLTHLSFLFHAPPQDLASTMNSILKQATDLAISRKLLLPAYTYGRTDPQTPLPTQSDTIVSLHKLIPRKKEDADMMVSDNPFARTAGIADKQARRLHSAIDGHKTVAELSQSIGMDMRSLSAALRILISLRRAELYDAQGHPVDAERVLFQE